jgi:hypothetical protein
MKPFRSMILAALAAVALSLASAGPSSAANGGGRACLSEPEIEAAIASGQIQSWAKVRELANIPRAYKEASDVQVCTRAGQLYFIVSMVSPKGEYFKIVLNAVDGSS